MPTDALPVARIPVDDYSAVWILASCENDAQYSDVFILRIGAKKGAAQTTYHDYEFQVPRANEKTGANVVRALPGENGNIFLTALAFERGSFAGIFQSAKLDEEIAKVKAGGETPARWLLFHEDAISGNHITRTPDLFTGKKYELNEAKKET